MVSEEKYKQIRDGKILSLYGVTIYPYFGVTIYPYFGVTIYTML